MAHHVLIIGGGLGGLALAQALRKMGIPYTIFERDESSSQRKQSWAVALESCLPDLVALLPEDLGDISAMSNNRVAGSADTACIMDVTTVSPVVSWGGGEKVGDEGFMLHANRLRAREWLSQNVEIRWGKKFERYEVDEEKGVVTAWFSDGASARGTVLVGADGAGSAVRAQLLGPTKSIPQPLPYGVIGAEFDLSADQATTLRKDSTAFQVGIQNGVLSFLGLREPMQKDGGDAKYYFHLYWIDHAAAQQEKEYWTQSATARELKRKASELTSGWKGSGKAAMECARAEDIMVPPFMLASFSPPPEGLPRGRVTLLGDAAHTMTPFRGIGANTALSDAIDLVRGFEGKREAFRGKGEVDVAEMLKVYEGVILPRGGEAVESSAMMLQRDPEGAETVGEFQRRGE